ncbi:MAG: hypothetical protein SV253_03550 [Halobacteria archaeon]|nr:hypothetical protein [Halobacteria archaeon]
MSGENGGITNRLGFKIVAVILVCSLVPLGITTYITETEAETALESKSTQVYESKVSGISDNAKTRSEFYQRQVKVVAANPHVQRLVEHRYGNETISSQVDEYEKGTAYPQILGENQEYQKTQEFFQDVGEDNPNIDMIRVFWKDGNVLTGYKLGEEDTKDYKGDKIWFEKVMNPDEVESDGVYVSSRQ